MGNTTARKRRGSASSRTTDTETSCESKDGYEDSQGGGDAPPPDSSGATDATSGAKSGASTTGESSAAGSEQKRKKKKKRKKRSKPDPNQFPFAKYLADPQEIWRTYDEMAVLGAGATCKVLHVLRVADDEHFAMKVMRRKGKWNPIMFEQEVDFLCILKEHPHVVQFDAAFYDDYNLYILTKLCTGGALFHRVKELRHFSEAQAAKIMATILGTINHCHKHDIVHRDLKPENIVYSNKSKTKSEIVIIDFGDARRVRDDEVLDDFLGTMYYLSPEMFRPRKGWEVKKSDVWTIGAIAYVLVCGRPPFTGRDNEAIKQAILAAKVKWPSYVTLSDSCKDFILALLEKDTTKRLTAEQALAHPWVASEAAKYETHLGSEMLQQMSDYTHSSDLKKLVVHRMVKYMTPEDRSVLMSAFESIDTNKKGFLQRKDLVKFYKKEYGHELSEDQIRQRTEEVFASLDYTGDGKIKLEEFIHGKYASAASATSFLSVQFDHLDHDGDGFISVQDLKRMLTTTYFTEQLEQVIDQVDLDGDGKISKEDFEHAMKDAIPA